MRQSNDSHFIPITSVNAGKGKEVATGVFYYTNQIVNVVMINSAYNNSWVLIDAGMPGSAKHIKHAAAERFGKLNTPAAILLTHGHFDHTGSIVDLLKSWKTPVYAHPLEFPFLTGEMDYPEPDTTVEGGMLARLSSVYPHEAIDIKENLQPLPVGGRVPFLPEWEWIHVPGHAPGQVAFYRSRDRVLISADAIITVRQDKLYNVLMQKQEVNGPPRYLTTDWLAAKASAKKLQELDPAVLIPGHGTAMQGPELKEGLQYLVQNFDSFAIPGHGKFVVKPEDPEPVNAIKHEKTP
jgi:glyoxylase-like metal-dependent hydrolase (beta-lactamase superfamily II)